MDYKLELADKYVVEDIYKLVQERIAWMDKVGIKQWNVTNYKNRYPKEYYMKQVEDKTLYVLKQKCDNKVVGAVVCFEEDERWENSGDIPAYYLHNFVTDINIKGAGREILRLVEKLALSNNKKFVRLDCIRGNEKLNNYYEENGYVLAGECQDGPYKGNLREKLL